jgi:isoquinoline 1-oxidoreductase beta subunit
MIGITAVALMPRYAREEENTGESLVQKPITAWVHLRPDGSLTIYSPAAEMGQGSLTAVPVIFAEEMDADWSKVSLEAAPPDPDTYGLQGWGGQKMMLTVGSMTVMRYFDAMRQAGAQARYVLLSSAAEAWKVPLDELSTEPGMILHNVSGRRVSYGEALSFVRIPKVIPEIPQDQLKRPDQFRLIGKVLPRYEIPTKVDGSAMFAIDEQVPGMVYGVIERGNLHGARPALQNEAAIRAMPGLVDVVALNHGIGVVAASIEQALKIKKQLNIAWDDAVKAADHSSQEAYEEYEKIATRDVSEKVLTQTGDVDAAWQSAAKSFEADYQNDYVYHAQMEPLNAIASVAPDGKSVEVWAGTQAIGSVAQAVAGELGIEASAVTFHPYLLGGGLGRRSAHDPIIEAVQLSRAVKQPVKLLWTREDDLRYGMYRPLSLQRMRGAVDARGELLAFSHLIVGDGDGLLASGAKNDHYTIPNQHTELRTTQSGIRLKHWRSVGHGPNKFAIEAFIDEIALDQKIDPLAFRRKLMKGSPRALKTLEKAAEMAQWGSPLPEGRARGIAFGERSGALCTGICEISLDRGAGKIRVHRWWLAVDAGIIVQPDNALAQLEGGIIMGMSSVLQERVTIAQGRIQESNFHDYPLLRMQDIPESIDIAFIDSVAAPQGIGEASTPIVGGAIANAFAALTGKHLRHLPFTPERVRAVLKS